MGAAPRWAMLALALPAADEAWLAAFASGFFALAARHGVDLVGGDTPRGPLLTINVTALGEVPSGVALYRAGARPGDDIWVSGELGGAALALAQPQLAARSAGLAARLHRPEPRVELGERLRGLARAAIDVSDGLAGDLGHILERSQVGAVIEYDRIPRPAAFSGFRELERDCLLSGGDDYELVFAAGQAQRGEIESLGRELKLPLTRIGAIQAGAIKLVVLDAAGKPMAHRGGFDHFDAAHR
jgi:thiamine-monophosphate kinase